MLHEVEKGTLGLVSLLDQLLRPLHGVGLAAFALLSRPVAMNDLAMCGLSNATAHGE